MRSAINATLIIFTLIIAFLYSAVAFSEPLCPIGIETESKSWVWSKYGKKPYICVRSCRYNTIASVCIPDLDVCSSSFVSTSDVCDDPDGMISGGELPEPIPPEPDTPASSIITNMPDNVLSGYDYGKSFKGVARVAGIGVLRLEQIRDLETESNRNIADIRSATQTTNGNLNSLKNTLNFIQTNSELSSVSTKSTSDWLARIYNEQLLGGGGGGGGLPNDQLNKIIGNIGSLNGSIYGAANNIQSTLRNELSMASMKAGFNKDEIVSAINNISSGGDNTNVINAINSQTGELKTGIDSLGKGIDKLNDFFDDGSFVSRPYEGEINFESLKLYDQSLLDSVTNDIEDLRVKYDEQLKEFKSIFSLDVSQLQSGQYKEHSLDFILPNGRRLNLKSGVLPALIDQANLIAAIILFIASLIAARAIFGGRK
ncbi:hypothetical protein [Vibrio aestuarianus]|uniref:hypothetical protein n=2 Tax=Vibrio aestuarianus TaxID=28171 RepID=UPI0014459D19|nr:hypothetical protein [Vibrio aestuarianus]MDE1214238.1 hypothetical protein [Vibrio aestuarianus]MDE1219395.1 hypothetical protein [Vibrio aestuarianus]MDE1261183.1 hypothetical protein [Vibrio aestuarianus]MDE1268081.1 hypothetical protein [Vibrio aestuarianus]MDE1275471.1 hypothetical protein [Vibrio aestuarianus]